MRLTKLLEARDLSALNNFTLKYTSDYERVVSAHTRDAYEYAKKGAADELKVAAPATKRDTTTLISQNAAAIADKQLADLLFIIKSAVLDELRRNNLSETYLGLSDILSTITTAFKTFFDDRVSLTGAIVVAQGINRGRADVFEANRNQIYGFQYSAILDGRTCRTCLALDGSVVNYADWRKTPYHPPIHFHCRCIWVAIRKDEQNPPAFTGMPEEPGGYTGKPPLLKKA